MNRRIDSFDPPEANPSVRRGRRRRSGPLGIVAEGARVGWRWLTRMRTALYILGILGVLTLVATVVPQEPNVASTVTRWRAGTEGPGQTASDLIDLLGGYDVYGSPAFLALLLLLFLSLTACLIPRVRAWWKLTTRGRPPASRDLTVHPHVDQWRTSLSPDEVEARTRELLRGRRFRLRAASDAPSDPGPEDARVRTRTDVAGERGIVSREGGSLAFHLSFYVLLLAIVFGQLLGFEGQVGVIERQAFTDTPIAYWGQEPGRWWGSEDHTGFTMTVDEFEVEWFREGPNIGVPRSFTTTVTVTTADGTTVTDTIGGNDPLVVDGMKIHQLEWGYAPRIVVEQGGEVVHDGFVTAIETNQGFFRSAVKAPGADPDIGLELQLYPTPQIDSQANIVGSFPWADLPIAVLPAYLGDLRLDRVQGVRDLDTTGLVPVGELQLPLGGTANIGSDITVSFPELRQWVGFQVSNRPTTPWLLLGGLLMLIGLVPALYAYRRRVWVRAEATAAAGGDAAAGTLVTVAGRAFQRPQAFEEEFDDLLVRLRDALPPLAGPADPAPGPSPDAATPDPALDPTGGAR